MKIFTASLATESNFFSPNPTSYQDYANTCLIRSGSPLKGPGVFVEPLDLFHRRAKECGWEVIQGLCALAFPSGRTAQAVYESFRDEILRDLKAAGPVDFALFVLHGAMAAFGYDDCEGDLLGRAREIVGPDVPIGV
ncbi:MAG: M81 family metallopeptidase, partial [Deltaproteobacteria bacterium]|nr:M81 family metallopeptidase [Deltaproteobacteria bacterium]